ncbi:MAG: homoserine dehydrogenase [Flavobacteriales bacterium]|nr:homoserine dehydrogenase [Flavobacteriales bacterium]
MSKKIALIGYGCVGQAFAEIIDKQPYLELGGIAVRDLRKPRWTNQELITDDVIGLIERPDIDIVVEASGDDKGALIWQYKCASVKKPFITANKQFVWQFLNGEIGQDGDVLYEASCTASIPIIRALETCFPHGVKKIQGILNGSSNYILSKVFHDGLEFPEALKKAQEQGFAEADPSLDLDGTDAATKLSILIRHAFRASVTPDQIQRIGIDRLNGADIHLAKQQGAEIKLIAEAELLDDGIYASVRPVLLDKDDPWCAVKNEKNAVKITDKIGEEYLFEGNGAGGRATGTALLNDVLAYLNGYQYSVDSSLPEEPKSRRKTDLWLRTHVMGERPDPLAYRILEHRLHGPFDLWRIAGLPTDLRSDPLLDHPENSVLFL